MIRIACVLAMLLNVGISLWLHDISSALAWFMAAFGFAGMFIMLQCELDKEKTE